MTFFSPCVIFGQLCQPISPAPLFVFSCCHSLCEFFGSATSWQVIVFCFSGSTSIIDHAWQYIYIIRHVFFRIKIFLVMLCNFLLCDWVIRATPYLFRWGSRYLGTKIFLIAKISPSDLNIHWARDVERRPLSCDLAVIDKAYEVLLI